MSAHLEHDTLWSLARNELDATASAVAQQHLGDCPDCRATLDDIKLAQGVLFDLPPVPAMPEAMARRIGQELAEAADARAAKSFTSWWQSLFTVRFVFAAAVAVLVTIGAAYLFSLGTNGSGGAPPQQPIAMPTPNVTPTPTPAPNPVTPAPTAKKLQVTVASAKKATASKKQVLDEGAVVSTQKGGSLWMQLPDGSRAGLTSASEVTLAKLESAALTLDVTKGSLALVVPHREDRVLTVRAGELEVKDLGTRFLVSREPSLTVVAVEEGVVEVKSPAGTKLVKAGRAVTWREGKLAELDWEPTPPAPTKVEVVQPVETGDASVKSIARLNEEDDDETAAEEPQLDVEEFPSQAQPQDAPPDRTVQPIDDQWAPLPKTEKAGPPPNTKYAPPKRERFSLRNLERKLREIGTVITSPSGREARARDVMLSADANDCMHALQLADRWLSEPVTNLPTEASMRRGVQLQQVRCLNHLGRKDDAAALQKMIDSSR